MEDEYAPRPKASQTVAAAKRARATLESDTPPTPRHSTSRQQMLLAAAAGIIIAAFVVMASYQLSGVRPRALAVTRQPTVAPTFTASGLFAAPTAAPATRTAPRATIAPSVQPTPVQPAQSGRGLGGVEPATPPAEVAPTYLEVVAEQAPHSPRGDGRPGPTGGDWVAVPTLPPEQAAVIVQQAPHKVR